MGDSVELKSRVDQFNTLSLPGQPFGIHMGTSYLVNDLWSALADMTRQRDEARAEGLKAVKVKPLMWEAHPTAPIWRCDTIIGTYKVFAMGPFPSWDFDSATAPMDKLSKRAETPEAAKYAAQDHYNDRIINSLAEGAKP